jgi:hypothetical protein
MQRWVRKGRRTEEGRKLEMGKERGNERRVEGSFPITSPPSQLLLHQLCSSTRLLRLYFQPLFPLPLNARGEKRQAVVKWGTGRTDGTLLHRSCKDMGGTFVQVLYRHWGGGGEALLHGCCCTVTTTNPQGCQIQRTARAVRTTFP